ncbi:RND transporter [Duganella sp. Leaf126]|nr:RND transporter [Duganella sp. Leaf126]
MATLSACAVTTPAPQVDPQAPLQWQAPLPHGGSRANLASWWRHQGDALLAELIESAQTVSPTVASAAARIAQSRADQVAAGAALVPNLDGTGSISRANQQSLTPMGTTSQVALQASWELDLFDANRAVRDAADARYQSAQAGWHDARVSVAAETANQYYALRACQRLMEVARQDAASRADTARLTALSANAGFESPANLALARASAADGNSRYLAQRASCDVNLKALVALTAMPETALRRRLARDDSTAVQAVAAGARATARAIDAPVAGTAAGSPATAPAINAPVAGTAADAPAMARTVDAQVAGTAAGSPATAPVIDAPVAGTRFDAPAMARTIDAPVAGSAADAPASAHTIDAPLAGPAIGVPELPAQTLAQRPDVFTAEREVAAASAEVGGARAQRYPRLGLSGAIGIANFHSAGVNTRTDTWTIGPLSVSVPVFDGGRRRASEAAASARYDAAVVNYRATVRQAVSEVEQAMVNLDSTARRALDASTATQGYRSNFDAVEQRYKNGMASLFELEDARRTRLAAEQNEVTLARERNAAWVALYRAAGGGWTAPAPAPK